MDFMGKNPMLTAGLGLAGGQMLMNQQLKGPEKALKSAAQQAAAQSGTTFSEGQTLLQPSLTGTLPPGQEAMVQSAVKDAINVERAKYAKLGLSGSTMESDAIANIQDHIPAIRNQIAENLARTGLALLNTSATELNLQQQVFTTLLNAQVAQDVALGTALSRFAAASMIGPGAARQAVVN